jgi:DNA-binding beta-propeller fold protein YncE
MTRTSVRGTALGIALSMVLAGCSGKGTASGAARASVPGYRVLRDVRLPGDTSRWDYQVYDPASRRLYIAHLGASQIVVFDTARQKVVGIITGIAGVHGLALAPDLGRLFAVDPTRRVVVGRYPLDGCGGAHGVQVDDTFHRIFVACEYNAALVVLDLVAGRVTQTFQVGEGPDAHSVAVDAATHIVYLPLTDVGGHPVLREIEPQ